MMKKFRLFVPGTVLGVFFAFLTATLSAQGAPAQQAAPAPDTAQAPEAAPTAPLMTPERQAYDSAMVDYKEKLKRLRTLKAEFVNAAPERRDAIIAEFTPLVKETETLQKSLIPVAIVAYQASGKKDVDVLTFLVRVFEWLVVQNENFERAYEVAKAIFPIEQLRDDANYLYLYAAYAAFNVMELEDAENWFKIAKDKDALGTIQARDPNDDMKILYMLEGLLPEYKELWAKEKEIRAKEAKADNLPRVLLKTTKGDIVLELFANEAPQAVGNFMTLVKDGFYNDVPFHRVLPFFMAQGGDPTGTGTGGPGYCIRCECRQPNARVHFRGSLSMAHAGPDTGGSQFFLTFVPTGFLNGKHTVFGRVIEGMDVLSELQRINPEEENLPAPDKIREATILRGEPTPFEKLPGR